jgi:hypothetical protein
VAAWYVSKAEIVKPPLPSVPEEPAAPPATPKEDTPSTPAPETPAAPTLIVYVSQAVGVSGLRLRSEPSAAGPLVKVLKARRALNVLEPTEEAKPKIGKQDAWLHVRDPENATGYVAAWLVTLETRGGAAPTSPPATTPTTPPSGPITPPVSPPTPGLIVSVLPSVGSSGLRIRAQPSLAGVLVSLVPAGHQLSVLEPEAQARAKIGVTDKWLSVKDTTGKTGYVAAWFVQEAKLATVAPPTGEDVAFSIGVPSDAVETLTVHVAGLPAGTPGLFLRESPASDGKVIKLLPSYLPLAVLDEPEAAEQKIGVYDDWLHVREPGGGEGYVAAWFVTR